MIDRGLWEAYRTSRKSNPPDKAAQSIKSVMGEDLDEVLVERLEDRYAAEEALRLLATPVASDLRIDSRIEREADTVKRLLSAMDTMIDGLESGTTDVAALKGVQAVLRDSEDRLEELVRRAKGMLAQAEDPVVDQLVEEYDKCGPTALVYIELLRVVIMGIRSGALPSDELRAYTTLAAAILSKLRSLQDSSIPARVRSSVEAIVRDILTVVASHLEAYPNLWRDVARDIEAAVKKHFLSL